TVSALRHRRRTRKWLRSGWRMAATRNCLIFFRQGNRKFGITTVLAVLTSCSGRVQHEHGPFSAVSRSAIRAALSLCAQPREVGGRCGGLDSADIFPLGLEGRSVARPVRSKIVAFYHFISRVSGPATARSAFSEGGVGRRA